MCVRRMELFRFCKPWRRCNFFFSSRRRHTRLTCDWSSDVCSSDLGHGLPLGGGLLAQPSHVCVEGLGDDERAAAELHLFQVAVGDAVLDLPHGDVAEQPGSHTLIEQPRGLTLPEVGCECLST